jgi:dihydroorotate dehydrogenase (NAD+) catalytic subunit
MLNAIGLQNPGLDVFISEKMPFLRKLRAKTIVNFFGSSIEDYAELAGRLDAVEGVDALEVNISCPNIKQGGLAFGSDPDTAARVARAVRQRTGKPVLVKLTPNVTDLVAIARAVADTGVDGLTLINTLRGMAIDYRSGQALLGNVIGGLSGPAIRPVAVRAVYEVAQALDIPIVGCGGIVEWQDAVEFLRAGACALQVGSATFRKPAASLEVLQGLEAYLREAGHQSVGELVSTVRANDGAHP